MNQLAGKGTMGGREREGMLLLFHFVGEVKNGMRRRRATYTYTYILYWLVFVLGARPLPMRVIIKHCHHLLNTHSRLATLASYPFIQYECECYSYFIMLFFKTFNLRRTWLLNFHFLYFVVFAYDVVMVPTFVVVVHVFAIFFVVLWLLSHTRSKLNRKPHAFFISRHKRASIV